MADINLGQVAGIWIGETEPIHKNVLWLKTINLLTNEKAGFIWNGTEWINIQGEGFKWKGTFDLATNYKKNDIVLFNGSSYIKLTNIVNNVDNPNVNPDFDVFVPAAINGTNGTNGANGTSGISAYQVWLNNGNVGTEAFFLNSLKGTNGSNGTNGTNGTNGSNGVGVPTGGTTGQVLSKINGTDYNTQWISTFTITETLQATIQTPATTESDKYVSARMFWSGIATLKSTSNTWTNTQTFDLINTKQVHTTKQTITITGASPTQAINLDNGSFVTLSLVGASGALNLSLINGKVGASYFIEVLQAATKVDVTLANVGRLDGLTGSTITGVNNQKYIIVAIWNGTGFILNIANLT
jgi:hypothetical protein